MNCSLVQAGAVPTQINGRCSCVPTINELGSLTLNKQCSHYEPEWDGFVLFMLSVQFKLLMIFNWEPFTKERLTSWTVRLEICLSK